jgi:hypothetical protein
MEIERELIMIYAFRNRQKLKAAEETMSWCRVCGPMTPEDAERLRRR